MLVIARSMRGAAATRARSLRGRLAAPHKIAEFGNNIAGPMSEGRFARQRFENWKLRRALALPYFLRSTTRGSRVRKPPCFSTARKSGSYASAPWKCRDAPRRPGPTARRRRPCRPRRTGRRGWPRRTAAGSACAAPAARNRFHRPVIDHDLAGARLDPDAGDRVLALAGGIGAALLVELLDVFRRLRRCRAACSVDEILERLDRSAIQAVLLFLRFIAATSSVSGCCAACGCSAPG